jgi:eukaryotic-like serine/threonine-protein kinase
MALMDPIREGDVPERPGHLQVGDVVEGRYELRRDLGRGAGGVVFEAFHRFTQRTVALKIVAPDVPVAQLTELRARLVREARALATARHPGIVEVLDGGVVEDGTPYFVMEKLDGRTLEGLLAARARLSPEETAAVMFQLCDAMDVAHRSGVVHRDLKPDNIFVVRERDGRERVKVVDFGTAQVASISEGKLSAIGAIIGTPAYMAPEQLLAQDDVDALADVYALGITMFECLTGSVPYDGNYQRVLLQVCSDDAPPNVRTRLPVITEVLAAVVQKAIAKKPGERFPNVLGLARAIHEAIPSAGDQTTFLGPPPPSRFGPATTVDPRQRRRAPRAPYVTPVHVILPRGSVDGRSEDISEGGLLVITRQGCEPNQRSTVRFALPIEGRVVSCDADVRWVRAARPDASDGARALGLEFVEPPAALRASIARYVEAMGGGAPV